MLPCFATIHLDHLARGPLESGWSLGVFLAGATTITLAFGYVIVMVGLQHDISTAWSLYAIAETGSLQRNIDLLVLGLAAVTGASAFAVRTPAHARARQLDGAGGRRRDRLRHAVQRVPPRHELAEAWPSLELRAALAAGSTISRELTLLRADALLLATAPVEQGPRRGDEHRRRTSGTTRCPRRR